MSRKRNVTVAAVQMKCSTNVEENIAKADTLVREAAEKGAQIILLPELFERQYFCQERRYEYYEFAKEVNENDAVKHFSALAKELSVVIPVSFYEKDVNRLFNTVAVIDADGSNLGIYRKTHIPDDHYYQEKFYFVPGDTDRSVDIRKSRKRLSVQEGFYIRYLFPLSGEWKDFFSTVFHL
jgi:N-carbamoylputrescine amidase